MTYRDYPEWQAVEAAIRALVERENEGKDMVVDFELTTAVIPKEDETNCVGGYLHFASSFMPHVNRGMLKQAEDYWREGAQGAWEDRE